MDININKEKNADNYIIKKTGESFSDKENNDSNEELKKINIIENNLKDLNDLITKSIVLLQESMPNPTRDRKLDAILENSQKQFLKSEETIKEFRNEIITKINRQKELRDKKIEDKKL